MLTKEEKRLALYECNYLIEADFNKAVEKEADKSKNHHYGLKGAGVGAGVGAGAAAYTSAGFLAHGLATTAALNSVGATAAAHGIAISTGGLAAAVGLGAIGGGAALGLLLGGSYALVKHFSHPCESYVKKTYKGKSDKELNEAMLKCKILAREKALKALFIAQSHCKNDKCKAKFANKIAELKATKIV